MKKIYIIPLSFLLFSCDSIKKIESNTTTIDTTTKSIENAITEVGTDIEDLPEKLGRNYNFLSDSSMISMRVPAATFLKREIISESTKQKSDDWFEFNLLTYDKFLGKKERVLGYYQTTTPEYLYVTSINEEWSQPAINIDSIPEKKIKGTFDNPLLLDNKEWQKLLITSNTLNLSGFLIDNRTISLRDMTNFSFNFSKINDSEFYKVTNASPYTTRNTLNTYNCLKITNSKMNYWELNNWFFTSYSQIYNDRSEFNNTLFYKLRTNNCHYLDVTHEAVNYVDCIFKYSTFSNNQFKNEHKFNNTNLLNCTIENSDFINDFEYNMGSIDSCTFSGNRFLRNKQQDKALFKDFFVTNTTFSHDVFSGYNNTYPLTFHNPTFLNVITDQGSFSSTIFVNGSMTNSTFKSDFNNVIFNGTYLYRVTFKSFQSPMKLALNKVNFSSIKLEPNSQVVFEECVFTDCTWPSNTYLVQNGVRFVNCANAPYDSE